MIDPRRPYATRNGHAVTGLRTEGDRWLGFIAGVGRFLWFPDGRFLATDDIVKPEVAKSCESEWDLVNVEPAP